MFPQTQRVKHSSTTSTHVCSSTGLWRTGTHVEDRHRSTLRASESDRPSIAQPHSGQSARARTESGSEHRRGVNKPERCRQRDGHAPAACGSVVVGRSPPMWLWRLSRTLSDARQCSPTLRSDSHRHYRCCSSLLPAQTNWEDRPKRSAVWPSSLASWRLCVRSSCGLVVDASGTRGRALEIVTIFGKFVRSLPNRHISHSGCLLVGRQA
jgi:hypothetical protein